MKVHTSQLNTRAKPPSGRSGGYPAKTGYPTGPVLQGRFLLSIGPSDIATGLPHGDKVVNNIMDYYDGAYGDAKQRNLRYKAPVANGRAGLEERSKDDHSVFKAGSLKELGENEELELVGHGGGPVDASGEMTHVTEFGGLSADDLAIYLIRNGLPSKYKGRIFLTGCSTGKGGVNSFSLAFQNALARQRHLDAPPTVTGYTGSVRLGHLDEKGAGHPVLIVDRNQADAVRLQKELAAFMFECIANFPKPSGDEKTDNQQPAVRLSSIVAKVHAHLKPFFYLDSILDPRATQTVGAADAVDHSQVLQESEEAIVAQSDAFLAQARKTLALIKSGAGPAAAAASAAAVTPAQIEASLDETLQLGSPLALIEIPDTSDDSKEITHEKAVKIPPKETCCTIM